MLFERWDIELSNKNREENMIVNRIKEYIIKNEDSLMLMKKAMMLRNGRILGLKDYHSQHAYVYINAYWAFNAGLHYPFLMNYEHIINAYLSKLGFYYDDFVTPAIYLRYVVDAVGYEDYSRCYLSIEVINLYTVASNLNLPKIAVEVLRDKITSGEKELTEKEYKNILNMFRFQKLLAGYNFDEVASIIYGYYNKNNILLANEVARIAMDYARLFKPYKVCYNMKSWDEVDC